MREWLTGIESLLVRGYDSRGRAARRKNAQVRSAIDTIDRPSKTINHTCRKAITTCNHVTRTGCCQFLTVC